MNRNLPLRAAPLALRAVLPAGCGGSVSVGGNGRKLKAILTLKSLTTGAIHIAIQ